MHHPIDWKRHSADLLQLYVQRGLVGPFEYSLEGWHCKNFTVWRKRASENSGSDPGDHHIFTGAFTCPIRGIHFPSGRLEKVQGAFDDGAFWYKSERRALQAAAAKAIDCIALWDAKTSQIQVPTRRCCDAMRTLPSGPPLPPLSWELATVLKKKRLASKKHQCAAMAA